MDGLPEVQRRDGPGVPVLWARAPGPVAGALVCRVGHADERLAEHGVTHLVEHLALTRIGRPAYDFNGHVEEAFTVFVARGTLDEVTGFLRRVGESLRALPVERLERERRILRTEAAGRDLGLHERLLSLRYGARGFGVGAHPEAGIDWLDEDRIRAWARSRFVAGAAAVWLSAEPPAGFAVELPAGDAAEPVRAEPIARLRLPAFVASGTGGVALTAVAPRSAATVAAVDVMGDRAHADLREEAGLSYGIATDYLRLDAGSAHVTLQADCQDRDAPAVVATLRRILDELAVEGATDDELARCRERVRRGWDDPSQTLATLDAAARDHLLGRPVLQPGALVAEADAVRPGDVAATVREVLPSLLVLAPAGTPNDDPGRHGDYVSEDREPVTGRELVPTPLATILGERRRVVVGDDGVTVRDGDGEVTTFRWDACAAVIVGLSGSLTFVGDDATGTTVHPARYDGGEALHERATASLADGRIVPLTFRERDLDPIVREQLPPPEHVLVGNELDLLAAVLGDAEELRLLAVARRGHQLGLVVVTDTHARFIFDGAEEQALVELPLRDVRGAAVKGVPGRRRLAVDADPALDLRSVRPGGRLRELAAALADR